MDQIGDETALSFLNGSNQGRGTRHRAVRAIGRHPAPYPHRMQPGEHPRPRSLSPRESASNDEETVVMTSKEGAISAPAQSPLLVVRTVSFLMDHQLELGIRALQTA